METLLLDAAAPGAIDRAAVLLAAGEVVALPTETVYGLAADAARPEALAMIFQVKERPLFDPLIVHLPDRDWLGRLTELPAGTAHFVGKLLDAFWPGPLTLVLPRRPADVPDLVTAGGELVAVRMSAHPVFSRVVHTLGRPLAAPSANRFGRISPTTGAHVVSELGGRVPLVLDAGPTAHGVESTVAAPRAGGVEILRHGPVTAEMLAEFGEVTETANAAARHAAPGQTAGHYAPRTRLSLLPSPWKGIRMPRHARIGFLGFRADRPHLVRDFIVREYLSEHGDLCEAAARLFAAMRRLDDAGLRIIYAERAPDEGIGRAINERLERAAAGSGPGGNSHPVDADSA